MTAEKCRICLCTNENLISIFSIRDSVMISTNVMSLTKIQIHPKDGLPSVICSKCLEMLDTCLNFISVCKKSDVQLRSSQSKLEHHSIKKKKGRIVKRECVSSSDENCQNPFLDDDTFGLQNDNSITLNQAVFCENRIKTDIQKYLLYNEEEVSKLDDKKVQKQQCFTCGKVMSSRFRLKTHLRTHTGERPFSCPHCNKNFSLAQNLKVHLRIHTGEKPLKCNVCGEKFAQSAGLAVHRRKHTGQTPYKCMLCPRSFRTIGHLQYHIRRHTGEKNFECDTCGHAFITRSDLKQHLVSHTGEKPHVCCVCGLRLTRASHLTRHIRHAHNDQKPFACNQCPSKFSQKSDFEKHKKKHIVPIEK